jgi:L-threonate 2-dehydrogenase
MHESVGVIGMGIMGGAMAKNLQKTGFQVCGYDPQPEANERAREAGISTLSSPREVASKSGIIFFSLPSSEALGTVVESISQGSAEEKIGIECSTLFLDDKQAAHDKLAAIGMTLLDCPVSGSGAMAASKELVVFASGDETAFKKAQPALAGMSRAQKYLGAFGNGSIMKYIANHLVTIHNVATAEAMVLGMKAGIDPNVIYETIADSAASSRVFQIRAPMMRDDDYAKASASIRTHLKDLDVIAKFARDLRCPTPLFSVAAQPYYAASAQGRDLEDTAAVCAILESLAGYLRR